MNGVGMAMGREISLGRPFGIPLTVNSWLAALAGIVFGFALLTRQPLEGSWILILFASILLHEWAHALTARAAGDTVYKVTLHLLGGVTFRAGRGGHRWAWRITAAGPLVNVLLAVAAWLALYLARAGLPAWALVLLAQAFWANTILAVFNLLPIYPMDGGQLARMSLSKRVGAGPGARIALGLSFFTLLAVGIWLVVGGSFNIIAVVVLAQLFMLNVLEMRQVGAPSVEETRDAIAQWWRERRRERLERQADRQTRRDAETLEPSPFRRPSSASNHASAPLDTRHAADRDAEVLREGPRLLDLALRRGLGALKPEERRLLILHRRLIEIRIDTAAGEPDPDDLRLLERHVRLGSSGEVH
ncbi:MAG: hypothetical protein GYA57_11355 [Myxococcales bacterium]|nr:hypothetical protein [Myxococcales bacterium]